MKIYPLPTVTLLLNAFILQYVTVGGAPKPSKCNPAAPATRSSVDKKIEEKKIHLIEDLEILSQGIKRENVPQDPDCQDGVKRDFTRFLDLKTHTAETLLPSDLSTGKVDGIGVAAVPGRKKHEILKFPKIVDEEDKPERGRGKSAMLMQMGKGVVRSHLYRPVDSLKLTKTLAGQKRTEPQLVPNETNSVSANATKQAVDVLSSNVTVQNLTKQGSSAAAESTTAKDAKIEIRAPDIPDEKASRLVTNVITNSSHILTIEEDVEDASDITGSKRTMNKMSFQKLKKLATPRSPVPYPKKITPDDAELPRTASSLRRAPASLLIKQAPERDTKISSPTIVNATSIGGNKAPPLNHAAENTTHTNPNPQNDTSGSSRSTTVQMHPTVAKGQPGTTKLAVSGTNRGNTPQPSMNNAKQPSSAVQQPNTQSASTKAEAPKAGGTPQASQGGSQSTQSAKPAAAAPVQPAKPLPPPDPYAEIANGPDSPKLPELKTSGEGVNSPLMKVDPESGTMRPVAPAKSDTSSPPPLPSAAVAASTTGGAGGGGGGGGGGSSQTDVGGLLDSLTDKLNSGTGAGVEGLPPPQPVPVESEPHTPGAPQQDVGGLLDTLTDKLNLGGNIATDQPIATNDAKYLQDQLNQYDQQAIMQAQGFNGEKSMKDVKAGDLQGAPDADAMYSKDLTASSSPSSTSSSISPVAPPQSKTWNDITSLDTLNAEATREEPAVGDSYAGDLENYAAPQSPQVSDAIQPSSMGASSLAGPSYSRQGLDAATAEDVNYEQQITGGAYNGATFGNAEAGNIDSVPQDSFENSYQGQYLRRNTIFRPNVYNFEHKPSALDAYTDYM